MGKTFTLVLLVCMLVGAVISTPLMAGELQAGSVGIKGPNSAAQAASPPPPGGKPPGPPPAGQPPAGPPPAGQPPGSRPSGPPPSGAPPQTPASG